MFDTKTRFRTLTRREEEIEVGTWKRNEREKKYDSRDIEVSSIRYRIRASQIFQTLSMKLKNSLFAHFLYFE